MFSTESSSSNVIRSVVPSPEIGDVRQTIENHQNHQSTMDIEEGSNISSVLCVLGQSVEPKVENVIILDEGSILVETSKTITAIGPNTEEVVINPGNSINDSIKTANVDKKQCSVSLERNKRRPLLETRL